MVSRVLPVQKPDLTPPEVSSILDRRLTPEVSNLDPRLTLSPEASNLSTVIPNNERSFNNTNANNQRLGRVQGLDPLAIKRAGKSHFIFKKINTVCAVLDPAFERFYEVKFL